MRGRWAWARWRNALAWAWLPKISVNSLKESILLFGFAKGDVQSFQWKRAEWGRSSDKTSEGSLSKSLEIVNGELEAHAIIQEQNGWRFCWIECWYH